MVRTAVLALVLAACGRSQGIPDQDLGGLVVETKKPEAPIDVDRAAKDAAELGPRPAARCDPRVPALKGPSPGPAGGGSGATPSHMRDPASFRAGWIGCGIRVAPCA
jgi:hypothetical protein